MSQDGVSAQGACSSLSVPIRQGIVQRRLCDTASSSRVAGQSFWQGELEYRIELQYDAGQEYARYCGDTMDSGRRA